jgi:hypothetical protein
MNEFSFWVKILRKKLWPEFFCASCLTLFLVPCFYSCTLPKRDTSPQSTWVVLLDVCNIHKRYHYDGWQSEIFPDLILFTCYTNQ